MSIALRTVTKRFEGSAALDGVSLEIASGELLALLGPSGSGKTTLLRVIAGLEFPDSGQVLFDGRDVTRSVAAERGIGFVFQQYALFSHMTVARNVGFGLDVRTGGDRLNRGEKDRRVQAMLRLVELDGFGGRFPSQLSGGQRQRVALARALVVEPGVLLLDEPFGALDATVRKSLRRELRRVHDAAGVTTVLVTHDQEEALELADRVAVMDGGAVHQVGTANDMLYRPATAFVAGFVGEANRFKGDVREGVFVSGPLRVAAPDVDAGAAMAFVRPHDFVVGDGFEVRVGRVTPRGPLLHVEGELAADDRMLEWTTARGATAPSPGDVVHLRIGRARVFSMDRKS